MTDKDLLNALRDCFDTALQCNIVDLGEVISASVREDHDAPGAGIKGVPKKFFANVELILPTRDEIAEPQLVAQIENRLAGLETISASSVIVLDEPVWTPERITPEGRRILGLDRPQRGGLIQIKLP